jgi:uncharacterized protein (DUF39 family)
MGNLKEMDPYWLVGASMQGYGCSLSVGLGIPIPLLNEEMAAYTAISDDKLFTHIVDYGNDYPNGGGRTYGRVSYAELKSGSISVNGQAVPTVPLSSIVRARMIADILKQWISEGRFLLGEPQFTLPV